MSTHPINTRNGFGGGFIGDYIGLTYGSDGSANAIWTDMRDLDAATGLYLQFIYFADDR